MDIVSLTESSGGGGDGAWYSLTLEPCSGAHGQLLRDGALVVLERKMLEDGDSAPRRRTSIKSGGGGAAAAGGAGDIARERTPHFPLLSAPLQPFPEHSRPSANVGSVPNVSSGIDAEQQLHGEFSSGEEFESSSSEEEEGEASQRQAMAAPTPLEGGTLSAGDGPPAPALAPDPWWKQLVARSEEPSAHEPAAGSSQGATGPGIAPAAAATGPLASEGRGNAQAGSSGAVAEEDDGGLAVPWQDFISEGDGWVRLTAVVRHGGIRRPRDPLRVELHPCCAAHASLCAERLALAGLPPPQCLAAASAAAQRPAGWTLLPVGPMVTATRECETLAAVGSSGLGSSGGISEQLLWALLRPDEVSAAAGGELARLWPSDMGRPEYGPYFKHLQATYDMPQVGV